MANGFNLTELTEYTEQNTDLLVGQILNTDILSEISLRTDVSSGKIALNIFTADTSDIARDCDFALTGDMSFDQIEVEVEDRAMRQKTCPTVLRDYWMSARMAPGASGSEELPFAETIAAYYLQGVSKNIEDYIGAQITAQVVPANGAQVPAGAAAITVANAIDQLNDIYDALPAATQQRSDLKFVMSPAVYRTVVRSLVAADLVHYNFNDGEQDIYLPGTTAKIIKSSGMVGDRVTIIAAEFTIFATGLTSDMEQFNMFWVPSEDQVKTTVYYRRGLGIYNVSGLATNNL